MVDDIVLDNSHVIEELYGIQMSCVRCHMCTCHSMHKLIVSCENVDGRVKIKEEKHHD